MSNYLPMILGFIISLITGSAVLTQTESLKGLWLNARKDSRNQARADAPGRMKRAPREVWRFATGGEVNFAQEVKIDGGAAVLLHVGSNLELLRWTGESLWRQRTLGAGGVMRVDDFDGDGRQEVLVRTDVRTVALLDVATGKKVWSWQSDPSTQILGHAFYRTANGVRFICFPGYSLKGYCFDFSANRENPKLLWQRDYSGKYGVGYGPNVVLADMDTDGKLDVVLSGKVPSVYHAVIDVDTGAIKFDVHYDLEGWGRPYGLLHASDLDGDGKPEIVMASCQVEEYIAVARNVEGRKLEKIWGKFIEKDWPTDRLELRPQITSVADVQGNGKRELIVGVYEDGAWHTLIIDPMKGFQAQRGRLQGYYFWGCYDLNGDGVPEIVVSTEGKRRPARITTLLALDGRTLQPLATLPDAAVFTSDDSPVPPNTYFMALQRNPVFLKSADGTGGILVRRFKAQLEIGTFLWGGKAHGAIGTRQIAGAGFKRIDAHEDRGGKGFRRTHGVRSLLLTDAWGGLQRFDANLKPVGKRLATSGRSSTPLVWAVGGKRELVVEVAGGMIIGGVPNLQQNGKFRTQWRVAGSNPALHLDAAGSARLAAVDDSDADHPAAFIYSAPLTSATKPLHIPLTHPVFDRGGLVPYGSKDFRLLVALQTGVHTLAMANYDADGKLLWADNGSGAYPNRPAAADLDGDGQCEVIADDHGVLRIYNPMGAVVATDPGWPPAYNVPIVGNFGPDGENLILRSSGMSGLALLDRKGKPRWKTSSAYWRYYKSFAAVGKVVGNGLRAVLTLGALAEDGVFENIEIASGKVRWSVRLSAAPNLTSVVAGDLDGNGADEFLVGLPDGKLVCIAEERGQGKVLWEKQFDASVNNPVIADVDGDGAAEIVISTSDGCVRILKE